MKTSYVKSLFSKNRIDRMADIEKVTRLMITLKIAMGGAATGDNPAEPPWTERGK